VVFTIRFLTHLGAALDLRPLYGKIKVAIASDHQLARLWLFLFNISEACAK